MGWVGFGSSSKIFNKNVHNIAVTDLRSRLSVSSVEAVESSSAMGMRDGINTHKSLKKV